MLQPWKKYEEYEIEIEAYARVHSAQTPCQSYAEGFENVRRVGHNSTPLVAYYTNNYARAQIFCRRAAAKEKRLREILEISLLKRCPCSLLPCSFASVRRHLVDRTPVRRKILKATPKIFGVT